MTNPRKPGVVVRLSRRELDELNETVQAYGPFMPRSSAVNTAIEQFLYYAKEQDYEMCRKQRVNLVIDTHLLAVLTEHAKAHGVRRTDLIRLAIRQFTLKYAPRHASAPENQNHTPSQDAVEVGPKEPNSLPEEKQAPP